MRFRSILAFCLVAALPAVACAAPETASQSAAAETPAAQEFHRVDLRPTRSQGEPIQGFPGLWIGPADAKPPEDPRLIWIHGSMVSMADPEKLVANIKASDAQKPEWSAPRVEVKEVGGLRGLLVQMDAGEGDQARSNLTLKMPLQNLAIDFVANATRAEFEKNLPLYERILLSVRPVETAKK
jgi:hypothetical protein